jgi:hypothetical protein
VRTNNNKKKINRGKESIIQFFCHNQMVSAKLEITRKISLSLALFVCNNQLCNNFFFKFQAIAKHTIQVMQEV